MPATTTLDVQRLGADLVSIASGLQSWSPFHAERMCAHIEHARQAMAISQYQVVASLMLACDEARSAVLAHMGTGTDMKGIEIIDRLNQEVCEAVGMHAYQQDIPSF